MAEDNSITVVGTPFSTFTRSVTMGLRSLGVDFKQIEVFPHSPEADEHHPFGRIPSLKHADFWLFEASAIANYVSATFPHFGTQLKPSNIREAAVVDRWVSLISDYVFRTLEHGLIKIRLAHQEKQSSESEIVSALKTGVKETSKVLAICENLAHASGPYLCGTSLTWADLFLLPIIDDLVALPEGSVITSADSAFPRLSRWYQVMCQLEAYKQTARGTLMSQQGAKSKM